MITDAQYTAWLATETSPRCLLVEATYRDTGTGAIAVEYLASMPFVSAPTDTPANQAYMSTVKAIPTFAQKMSEILTGRTTANLGNIEVFGGSVATDAWVLSRDWVGRSLKLFLGAATWQKSDFRAVWSGVIADVHLADTNTIVFEARDMQHLLNQPANVNPCPAEADANKPLPQCYGTCYNVSPVLIDSATHKYAVHDGAVRAITAVYADGVAAAYTASLATGTFTLTAAPNGQVTCDVQGAVVGGTFLQTVGQLLLHFATVRGAMPLANVDTASLAALDTLCPQPLGIYVGATVVNVYALMDLAATSVGAYYAVSRDGLLYAKRFDFAGTPVLTIRAEEVVEHGLTLTEVKAPVKQILLGGPKNWTVQNKPADGITEARRAVVNTNFTGSGIQNPTTTYGKVVDPGLIETMLAVASDALAEATRRMTLWGVPRYRFAVDCFTAPLRLNLGDTVTLIHPRYGLSAGKSGVVVDLQEQPSKKRIRVGVMV